MRVYRRVSPDYMRTVPLSSTEIQKTRFFQRTKNQKTTVVFAESIGPANRCENHRTVIRFKHNFSKNDKFENRPYDLSKNACPSRKLIYQRGRAGMHLGKAVIGPCLPSDVKFSNWGYKSGFKSVASTASRAKNTTRPDWARANTEFDAMSNTVFGMLTICKQPANIKKNRKNARILDQFIMGL